MARKTAGNLATRYLDLLSEEGYRPKLDESDPRHAVITFKAEGKSVLLFIDEDDESFLHLGVAFDLGNLDGAAALDQANQVNEELKVVKVTICLPDRAVRFNVEVFLEKGPAGMALLQRGIGALRSAVARFFEPVRSVEHLDA